MATPSSIDLKNPSPPPPVGQSGAAPQIVPSLPPQQDPRTQGAISNVRQLQTGESPGAEGAVLQMDPGRLFALLLQRIATERNNPLFQNAAIQFVTTLRGMIEEIMAEQGVGGGEAPVGGGPVGPGPAGPIGPGPTGPSPIPGAIPPPPGIV